MEETTKTKKNDCWKDYSEARKIKMEMFVQNLALSGYNVLEASEKSGITSETGYDWMELTFVKALIRREQRKMRERYDITIDSIEQELATIAYDENDKLMENKALHNKVKALELLGIQRGAFVKGVDLNLNVNLGDRLRNALERRKQRLAAKQQETMSLKPSTIQDIVPQAINNTSTTTPEVASQE